MRLRGLIGAGAAAMLVLGAFGGTAASANTDTGEPSFNLGELTLSPATVEAGADFTISTGGAVPCWHSDVFVEFQGLTKAPDVSENGKWSTTFTAPLTAGSYTVSATCDMYGDALSYEDTIVTVIDSGTGADDGGAGFDGVPTLGCYNGEPTRESVGDGFAARAMPQAGNNVAVLSSNIANNKLSVRVAAECNMANMMLLLVRDGATYPDFSNPNTLLANFGGTGSQLEGTLPVTGVTPGNYNFAVYQVWGNLVGWTGVTLDSNGVWALNGSAPAAPTAPAIPDEASLTGANAAGVSILGINGSDVTLSVDSTFAGQTVWGTIFSTPTPLGSAVVDANGKVAFTLPAGLEAGSHKITVQTADGKLVGWTSIELAADGTWSAAELTSSDAVLANTGGISLAAAGIAGAAAIGAGALLMLVRRRAQA